MVRSHAAAALGASIRVVQLPATLTRLGDSGETQSGLNRLAHSAMAAPGTMLYLRSLRRAISDCAPDVIHTNGFKMHVLGSWSCGRAALVWHVHDYVGSRPIMRRLLRLHGGRCRAAIAVSSSVARDLTHTCGPRLSVFTMHNATDLEQFSPQGPLADLDRLSSLPSPTSRSVAVGLVGSFARWKGHEVFLQALSLLPPDLPVRGYIVGDAIYRTAGSEYAIDDLVAMSSRLGVTDKVGFTGFVDQPAEAMRALDIVVHASTQPEPFGMVIIEAMACGRALIISRGGGASEIISPGIDALDYTPGAAEELAAQISVLVRSAELRTTLGRAARNTVVARYDRKRLGPATALIYRQAAATRARSNSRNLHVQ